MRTTVELSPEAAKAVEQLRRDGRGVSEAVNELIHRGLAAGAVEKPGFVQPVRDLGLSIDVSDVAGALETLDGPAFRS